MITQTDIRESLKTFLPAYPSSSRIWIYQSSIALSDDDASRMEAEAKKFASEWAAHGKALDATARVVFNRFLILVVNPAVENASGCSIDNSIHFVQQLEKTFNTQLFERTNMAVYHDGQIVTMPMNNLRSSVAEAALPHDSLLFDNSITTLGELRSTWVVPVYTSWIAK